MWRRFAAVVVVALLVGCTRGGGAAVGPLVGVPKREFLGQLVALCAGVNRKLADANPEADPGRVADQLDGFVRDARSMPAPTEDRQSLERFLSAMGAAAKKFKAAQAAVDGGDKEQATAATKEASDSFGSADTAGRQYGMPHLNDCDKALQAANQGAWQARPDARVARQQVAVAVAEGTIWVLGGLEGNRAKPRVEGYDPAIDTWKAGPDLPIPLHHATAVTYRGELVVLGGWVPQGSNLSAVVSDRAFVLRAGRWEDFPKLNRPRTAGAAAVVGDKIVLVGGQADGTLVAATEVFDGKRWRDAADIPTLREHLAAAADGPYLYAVGGRALTADKNTAALERFNPDTGQWERLPSMPTARGGLGAAVVDGRLIAVGGEQPTGVFATVEAYDIAGSSWSALPSLRAARHGLGVVAIENVLYTVNGARQPTHAESSAEAEALEFS